MDESTGNGGREQSEQEVGEPQREPMFNIPGIIIILIGSCVAVQLFQSYALDPRQDMDFMLHGAFIPIRYTGRYDLDFYAFTSPISYAFLHGGWTHLLVNMIWLAAFGSPLAARMGNGRFLAFWVFTALAAALFHFLTHLTGNMPVVGASGAISGMMGAASRFGFQIGRLDGRPAFAGPVLSVSNTFRSRTVVVFLVVWMVVNLIAGMGWMTPGIDSPIAWQAHIGGFLAGFFFTPWFIRSTYRVDVPDDSGPFDPLEKDRA